MSQPARRNVAAHATPPIPTAQLRAFHAVATSRGFTDAARMLGITQPAVSMQVRALETTYGVELFRRRRAGAALTDLGAELLERVRPMFALEVEAAELLGAAGAGLRGHLRVGADAPFRAVPALARFRVEHPAMQISLTLGNSAETLRDLLDGRTDVAFLSDRNDDPRLFAAPIARSVQVVIVATTHALAGRKRVRLRDLAEVPMIVREQGSSTRRAFERAIAEARVSPPVVLELGSREAVLEGVAAGIGAAVVIASERGHDARIVALPIADAVIEHIDYVVCLQERRRLRGIRAFLAIPPRLPATERRARR